MKRAIAILTMIVLSACKPMSAKEAYIADMQMRQQKSFEDSFYKMSRDMRDTQRLQMEQNSRVFGYPAQPIIIIPTR